MYKSLEKKLDSALDKFTLSHRGNVTSYLIASALIVLSLLVRFAMAPAEAGLPFLTFFPAVTLAAILGGMGSGLFTMVICSVIASYFFIPPFYALPFTFHPDVIFANLIFCGEEITVILVAEAMFRQRSNYLVTAKLVKQLDTAKQELQISAAAFESQEGIMITDINGVILRVNQAFTSLTGYSVEEAVGQTPRLLKSGHHDAAFYAEVWKEIKSTGNWKGEILDRRKNGEVYPAWMSITAIKSLDNSVTNYVAFQSDITDRKAADDEIRNLAFYDPLTKLPNRRLLVDRLHQLMTSNTRSKNHCGLLFIDMDNFKTLNDTKGHVMGDFLLQEVASRLLSSVRESDTVARLGGDEFVVLMTDLSHQPNEAAAQTKQIGGKILDALCETYKLKGHDHHCSASIGVSLFCDDSNSIDTLMKQADIAMYQAKSAGRNTLRFFYPEMQKSINVRVELENDLRKALAKKQLHLYYQIQCDNVLQPFGAEALIRWIHPTRGMVSPLQFIPIAEASSLILDIGHWVLDSACNQLATWSENEDTKDLILAINVSAYQFAMPDFVSSVENAVQSHRIDASRLKLELTESVIVDDINSVIAKMHAINAIGVKLSLDDFGTGYSSLTYLKRLPIDQIKIDQSFVRDIVSDPNDAVMVKTIIDMARNFNLNVIAEGVETEEQLAFLNQNGCMAYQGYLFSKPVPIHEFEALLKKPNYIDCSVILVKQAGRNCKVSL